jgi:alkylation response protein AidB-like acyl-CoA dehydrogenase
MHPMTLRQGPDREALAIVIPADLLEQLHSGTHPFCRPPVRALTRARSADDRTEGGARSSRRSGANAGRRSQHLAEETLHHCIRACGARSLVRPSPIERILRDLTLYLRHDNDDHILATIGRAALGETHDPSFHKP